MKQLFLVNLILLASFFSTTVKSNNRISNLIDLAEIDNLNHDYSNKLKKKNKSKPFKSIEIGQTITKVRSANGFEGKLIIGSTFDGGIVGVAFDGIVKWENKLSGFMNHDIWCEDITGDGVDEIFAANANGTLYCLDANGKLLWDFKVNDAPMYSVCVVNKNNTPYVVCGGFDNNIYYLNSDGSLKQTLESSSYSKNRVFGGFSAPQNKHIANFVRKVTKADGTEQLLVIGTNNSMQAKGYIYLFNVLDDLAVPPVEIRAQKPTGDVRVCDIDGDGNDEVLLGSSTHINNSMLVRVNPFNPKEKHAQMRLVPYREKLGNPGYRVIQSEVIEDDGENKYFILSGTNIIVSPLSMNLKEAEFLKSGYAFNDMWKDQESGKIILASDQSGGSAIHILDVNNPGWKKAYENMKPIGNIKSIIENTAKLEKQIASFKKPAHESVSRPVYLLHDNFTGVNNSKYNTPVFIPQTFMPEVQDGETWNRDTISNEKYRTKRDRRKKYILDQDEVLDKILPQFGETGFSYWGGHGNDPYFYSKETTKKIIDAANGRHTVLIYPEINDNNNEDTKYVLDDLFYNLAEYGKDKNLKLFIRSKNIFWQGSTYLYPWSRLLSGEYANVFVPSMEETSDKTMELSVSGRMGVWLSGAVDEWGSRAVPDNTSFDRLRQNSDQSLDNHFLRQLIYAAANGATYFDNYTKPDMFAKLLASGALYVPKKSELLSLSPVHLSMLTPDEHYLDEGSEIKWLTKFDQEFEDNNPFVFSRMNGTWPGAPINEWDFSHYAAGVKDRRLHFLPPYENGMVLITPPQDGKLADYNAPRGKMIDKLHPLYKDIMKEHYTDGRYYYSADGTEKYLADEYYKTIEADIEEGAKKLPLTVTGGVAWVVAQTSPIHLRLTLIDSGYINPNDKKATVQFNTVNPVKVTDVVDGETFNVIGSSVEIAVSCGMFRFVDIELDKPF